MPQERRNYVKKNNKREPPQKWECNSDHDRFVRIFESMFESPAFIALTPVAMLMTTEISISIVAAIWLFVTQSVLKCITTL